MNKLFYSIGEIAEILGESTSLVRFWSNSFPKYIKPKRNKKGNRMFTPADVETFKQIHVLVKTEGLTLDGAAKRLNEDRKGTADKTKVLSSLRAVKAQLLEIRKSL